MMQMHSNECNTAANRAVLEHKLQPLLQDVQLAEEQSG